MNQEYAISQYHDTNEIYEKLNQLISQRMRPVRREKMQEFLNYFDDQCKRSKELTDEAKKFIPEVVATVVAMPGVDVEACRRLAEQKLGVSFKKRIYDEVG